MHTSTSKNTVAVATVIMQRLNQLEVHNVARSRVLTLAYGTEIKSYF